MTEFRTPPTDAQTEFDAILGMEATIETHLPGSIHFMHRAQNVNGEDSKSHSSTQDHTQEPVYHVDSKPDRHSISLVAPHGRPHSDADNFSYQDLYNRSFDSSSVSFHQDAAAASPSEAFPNRSLSLGLPPTPLNPEGDLANDILVHYDPRALPSAMPFIPTQSGSEILTIPHQPGQLRVNSDYGHGSLKEAAFYEASHVPVDEHVVHAQTETTISGTYLEQTFGIDGVKSLPFENPSDPVIQTAPSPTGRPGHVFLQDLFVPYDRTKRTFQERSKSVLLSPTFFKCDDGSIGVPLRRAKNGDGLTADSNVQSPLGDRQTLQLKIIPRGRPGSYDSQLSTASKERVSIDLKKLMKLIAKRTHQFLEKSVFAINDHVPSSDGFRQTFAGPPDEVLLIGYTFVSKGAIMPILYFPSGWR